MRPEKQETAGCASAGLCRRDKGSSRIASMASVCILGAQGLDDTSIETGGLVVVLLV